MRYDRNEAEAVMDVTATEAPGAPTEAPVKAPTEAPTRPYREPEQRPVIDEPMREPIEICPQQRLEEAFEGM